MNKALKRCVIFAIGCLVFFGVLNYMSNKKSVERWQPTKMNFSNVNTLIYMKAETLNSLYDEKDTVKEIIKGDRNIFFLETSHIKEKNQIVLNARQCCAVESAARMNPTMRVYLYIFGRHTLSYFDNTKNIVRQLMSYQNIVIRHISLKKYFENSPMDEWWNSTNGLSSSHWFSSHMSDVLRYLTLWKFGGVYLDLDVVIKSSLEHLKNFVGAEDSLDVAAGVIGFDVTDAGRRYANACLIEIMTNFRGDDWGYNGPGVITRTLKKLCNTDIIGEMTPDRCGEFEIFPPSAFYPIEWRKWKKYFDIEGKELTMKTIEKSLAIHVWNKHSQSTAIKVGSEVPYAEIASKYCPKVYNNCGTIF